jgi:hypothetical protein
MEKRDDQIGTTDLGLIVFVVISTWLLIFYSGIF